MIITEKGNLLEAKVEALVNTVNCVGVMGKGIALQFKQAFPENFKQYEKACRIGEVKPGKMFVFSTDSFLDSKYIINFPTKRHWREKSKIGDIETGLKDLINVVKEYNMKSIAIPPLGCGNGGLEWREVKPLIIEAFKQVPDVEVHLYEPGKSPQSDKMKIGTTPPKMTRARALFISLMNQYSIPGYRLSLLEIQKLAYFLQEVGEPLKLNFEKNKFGPYAENLNHVLQRIEGHFIRGYGDRNSKAEIYLLPSAAQEAMNFLVKEEEALNRLVAVEEIIEGFETPYGLELLSTVHWIVKKDPAIAETASDVIFEVHNWNERKKLTFKENHILKALKHLTDKGLFTLNPS